MKNKFQILITLIIIFAFISCGSLNRKYPKSNFYTLNVGNIENKVSQGNDDLKIMRVRLNSGYYLQDFNYRLDKNKFTNDFYNKFYKPIDTIVSSELYKWFSNSELFGQVVPQNSVVSTRYFLYANILDIYADFSEKPSKAVLNMQFFLTDESGDTPEVIFTSVYNRESDLNDSLPSTIVDGWNEELKNILNDFENDLSELSIF
ncbi:MAG: hypothetical protein GTO02_14985 [Candidatus Dadabacteria bacterium]|nr:hypothetical protein [Candidatus Dadabacteria bacterium]NIQ15646.1 hypothetical protein [Candidatus Dadabacteria bacterium]